jgi:hypothetical protein
MTDTFVAFDPGVKYLAWALFSFGKLRKADLYRGDFDNLLLRVGSLRSAALAVVECPTRNFGVPEKDICELCRAAGEIGIQFDEREYVSPSEWKGQVPKTVHHPRILTRLTDEERAVIPEGKTARKHILDAVGIGLWRLGRMK